MYKHNVIINVVPDFKNTYLIRYSVSFIAKGLARAKVLGQDRAWQCWRNSSKEACMAGAE